MLAFCCRHYRGKKADSKRVREGPFTSFTRFLKHTLPQTHVGQIVGHPQEPILGVVLAGGKSSRMGRCKATLPHPSGGTFLTHAIDEIAKVSAFVAVSLNSSQHDLVKSLPSEMSILYDRETAFGPAEGILRSVQHAITSGCAGVFATPVDLPRLHGHELQALAVAFEETPTDIICGVSADSVDRIEPLVAIYPVCLIDKIQQLVASDDRSLYRFIQRQSHQTVRLSSRSLANINTPEDLTP